MEFKLPPWCVRHAPRHKGPMLRTRRESVIVGQIFILRMADFDVFKSFYSEEQALSYQQLLSEKGIVARIEKKRPILDKIYIGEGTEAEIYLMLKGADFKAANAIIDEWVNNNLDNIDSDYYLFSFSDNELMAIIQKPDEWSNQDVILARKLLSDRGRVVSDNEMNHVKSSRTKELLEPDKERFAFFLLGYIMAFFVPLYGVFFGLVRLTAKKVLPDGIKVSVYSENARKHYTAMVVIGTFMSCAMLLSNFNVLFPVISFF